MARRTRRRIATILRRLAARLKRQPTPEPVPWVPSVGYSGFATATSNAAADHVRYTHGGSQ